MRQYAELSERLIFVPIAFGAINPMSKGSQMLIRDLAKQMKVNTGATREGEYMKQQLSRAVCRGNAIFSLRSMG